LAKNHKFFPPPSYLAPSFGVAIFEFMEKIYGSWNYSLPGSRRWRFGDPSLHHFWLILPCGGQIDGRTELRWLWRTITVPAVTRKNYTLDFSQQALVQQKKLLIAYACV